MIPAVKGEAKLDILVEAIGRVNFGKAIHDRKGITDKVELQSGSEMKELKGWNVYNFPVDADFSSKFKFTADDGVKAPAYYKGTFNVDKVGDTYLDMSNWGKGLVWVNGHAIGRFWKIGPQQTLFMPGCWLKKGKNEIVVLDIDSPKEPTITGLDYPILDQIRIDESMTHRKDGENLDLNGVEPVKEGEIGRASCRERVLRLV